MGKKRQTNISRHIKTRHKKNLSNRKLTLAKVDPAIKNINQVISQALEKKQKSKPVKIDGPQGQSHIEAETISVDALNKLLGNEGKKKEKLGKLTVDDAMYLEKMLQRWGQNYGRMAQDIKLNKMQWTAQQIEKKHQTYKKMFPEGFSEQPNN